VIATWGIPGLFPGLIREWRGVTSMLKLFVFVCFFVCLVSFLLCVETERVEHKAFDKSMLSSMIFKE
jgi:hypothetical protein